MSDSKSKSTSTPSDSAGQRQDGPRLGACNYSCTTCFSTLRLFGGQPQDRRFRCMRDGGLCRCDGKISGLMSRWHQIVFFFFFSLTSPLQLSVRTSSSAAPYIQWCRRPSFQNNRIGKGPVLCRGHASCVVLFGPGPHGFIMFCHSVMYLFFFQ